MLLNRILTLGSPPSARATRRTLLGSFLLPALLSVGCGPGQTPTDLECGEGTEDRNGTCVAVVDAIDSCGEGTIFDDTTGKCEPTVRCGDGTVADPATGECVSIAECGPGTELDLASGECIPVASCGPGTVLDETSGECLPEAACGVGTVLEDGECVAVGTCAPGSVLNLDTGLCESNTACGPGQIVAGGQCVDPNVAVGLEADATESIPDQNDPLFGGVPEPLTLEPVGEQTVFVGNIDRPNDFGGNGTLTQDRDVWSVTGSAGQYLKISVLGTGLPQPAFIVEGPNGYRRVSPLLSTNDTSREVVLPFDGVYEITVVPTAFVSTALPLGSTSSGYVGVIEALEHPTPTTIVPAADQAVPLEVTGNLRDLSDNFLLLDADVGDAVSLIFAEPNPANPPAILAFDASGALITYVDLNLEEGAWVGTLVKEDPGTTVVVDWQSSTASDDAYTLRVAEAPHVQGGTVTDGVPGQTATTPILGEAMAAFTVTLPSPLILTWDVDNTSRPDIQMQTDGGTYGILYDEDSGFFYGAPASYTFFVFNDDTGEDEDASLVYNPIVPLDLGTLDPATMQQGSVGDHLLTIDAVGPTAAWMVVRTTAEALLSLKTKVEVGDPEITVYNRAGQVDRFYWRAREQAVHAETAANDPLIVLLEADSTAVVDWSVTATAMPIPAVIDVEPNDVSSTANELGALPVVGYGFLKEEEVDRYKLTLDAPLPPGQSIEIHVENLDTTATSFTSDSFRVAIFDELDQVVSSAERYFGDFNQKVILNGAATQSSSTFYIEISEYFLAEIAQNYMLRVQVVDTPSEVEPNGTSAEADAADALPATWYGQLVDDDVDFFKFTVPTLAANEALHIRFDNFSSSRDVDLFFEDTVGNVLASVSDIHPQILSSQVPAGDYFLRVEGESLAHPYRLTVEVVSDVPVELEPNEDLATAYALGELPDGGYLYAFGATRTGDSDWFSFSLPAALDADEGLLIRALNLSDTTSLRTELYDVSDVDNPVLISAFSDNLAVLKSSPTTAGPFAVHVSATSSSMEPYYVRVEVGAPAEKEPNDDIASAHYLGALADGDFLYAEGNGNNSDDDWFTFTLDATFPADAGIWLNYQNYFNSDDIVVELYDASDAANLVLLASDDDDPGETVSGPTGATLYAVHVVGTDPDLMLYEVIIEPGPRAEVEPNGDAATATPLGALPASLHGSINNTQIDTFSFTLAADLGATEAVEIYFHNLTNSTTFDVHLRSAGTSAATDDDDEMTIQSATGLAAGDYTVTVEGTDSSSDPLRGYTYILEVRTVDTSVITP